MASWFDIGPGFYAAMPGFRDGSRVLVTVCARRCVSARVITQCQCFVGTAAAKVIDVSPDVFRALGYPLSAGVAPVSVSVQ